MSSDFSISVNLVSKCYRIFARPQDRLKQMFFRKSKTFFREFWALKDVSLDIKKGSTLGILGRNGAGKSTLLQIICGTLSPTNGEVKVSGRIGALLELGTGFNPEFTGRENIFLNGTILGLSEEEIKSKFDSIVAFADIGNFIDQPVKTYSSGMFVRLAFSVAINIDPEILVVDEALSVGDVQFQAKCFRKFEELRKSGKTIIFVTHAPEQIVRHCDRAILIEDGKLIADGEPKTVVNKYLDLLFGASPIVVKENIDNHSSKADIEAQGTSIIKSGDAVIQQFISSKVLEDGVAKRPGFNKLEYRWGSRGAVIEDALICADNRYDINNFGADEKIYIYLKVRFYQDVAHPIYAITFKTPDGITIYGSNSRDWDRKGMYVPKRSGEIAVVKFTIVPKLITGHYLLSLGVVDELGEELIPLDRRYDAIEIYVTNATKSFGLTDLGMEFSMLG
ncbi:MAG: ABC transporter ATP-binding protein [bacterium]|nr:ABC transporter ATP-binding protein [bacterium]